MNIRHSNHNALGAAVMLALMAGLPDLAPAQMGMTGHQHLVDGHQGSSFNLTAKSGYLSTGDGNSIYFWGYAIDGGLALYSGPTLIVNQGDTVTVKLDNELPVPVSITFPGHRVNAVGGDTGLLTQEAPAGSSGAPGGPVSCSFTADHPGTYLYHSGTRPDLQVEMGLVGALIVRPTDFDAMSPATWRAYPEADSRFDHEYLFLLSEMDEKIHDEVELQVSKGVPVSVDMTKWYPVYWFINGRTGADTMLPAGGDAPYLPAQPHNCMPMFHPGQEVLLRVIGGGHDSHPLHHHGNHSRIIARDGRPLSSGETGAGSDLACQVFTIASSPGSTIDALYSWTGQGLGWDVYGHSPADPLEPFEDPAWHGIPLPTKLPTDLDLTYGVMYGGSPFLGTASKLPPGQGGFNPNGGFAFMWHSHNEKELVDNNIFPGGMMTMTMLEAWPPGTAAAPVAMEADGTTANP